MNVLSVDMPDITVIPKIMGFNIYESQSDNRCQGFTSMYWDDIAGETLYYTHNSTEAYEMAD
jgi:hypothetical protein